MHRARWYKAGRPELDPWLEAGGGGPKQTFAQAASVANAARRGRRPARRKKSEPTAHAPVTAHASAAAPPVKQVRSGDSVGGGLRFIELPGGPHERVLVGQIASYVTFTTPDGLVLAQLPIATSPSEA